jgi:hypothetical protein
MWNSRVSTPSNTKNHSRLWRRRSSSGLPSHQTTGCLLLAVGFEKAASSKPDIVTLSNPPGCALPQCCLFPFLSSCALSFPTPAAPVHSTTKNSSQSTFPPPHPHVITGGPPLNGGCISPAAGMKVSSARTTVMVTWEHSLQARRQFARRAAVRLTLTFTGREPAATAGVATAFLTDTAGVSACLSF